MRWSGVGVEGWGWVGYGSAKHVAGGKLGDVEQVNNFGGLSALACARRAKQDHDLAWPKLPVLVQELLIALSKGLLSIRLLLLRYIACDATHNCTAKTKRQLSFQSTKEIFLKHSEEG